MPVIGGSGSGGGGGALVAASNQPGPGVRAPSVGVGAGVGGGSGGSGPLVAGFGPPLAPVSRGSVEQAGGSSAGPSGPVLRSYGGLGSVIGFRQLAESVQSRVAPFLGRPNLWARQVLYQNRGTDCFVNSVVSFIVGSRVLCRRLVDLGTESAARLAADKPLPDWASLLGPLCDEIVVAIGNQSMPRPRSLALFRQVLARLFGDELAEGQHCARGLFTSIMEHLCTMTPNSSARARLEESIYFNVRLDKTCHVCCASVSSSSADCVFMLSPNVIDACLGGCDTGDVSLARVLNAECEPGAQESDEPYICVRCSTSSSGGLRGHEAAACTRCVFDAKTGRFAAVDRSSLRYRAGVMSIGRSFVVGLRQEVVVNAQVPKLGSATSRFVAKKVSKAGIGMRKVRRRLFV